MIHIEHEQGTHWTAVRTKPRCEKIVAEHCRRYDIACYLPLRRRAARYQRRTVETFLPMFPGYIFAQLGNVTKDVLVQSHKTVAILPIDDAQEATLIDELRDIQTLEQASLEADLTVQPELMQGKPVRITGGPLAGLRGIVNRRHEKTRVTVNVEMLGQSVSAELDVGDVHQAEE